MGVCRQRRGYSRPIATLGFAVLALVSCRVELLHDVDEAEANTVVGTLDRAGIPADKTRVARGSSSSYVVSVPSGDVSRALALMRRENLPRTRTPGLGDVFGQTGLVPTATQERALLRHALSGELTRTLQSVEGVQQAHVQVVLPERDPLTPADAQPSRARASVLLTVNDSHALTADEVRNLVAGSVEGLAPEAVRVVIHQRPAPSAPSAPTWVAVGPYRVASSSRVALVATLGSSVVIIAGLALALILLYRRNRMLSLRLAQNDRGASRSSDTASSLRLFERSLSQPPSTRTGQR